MDRLYKAAHNSSDLLLYLLLIDIPAMFCFALGILSKQKITLNSLRN